MFKGCKDGKHNDSVYMKCVNHHTAALTLLPKSWNMATFQIDSIY